jgi:hypothetical protein
MPIFCNSINKVLAALALESDYVWRPARNHPSGSDTAGKLGSDRGAAVAFEKHFTFSPFALRDQIRPQLAIYLSVRINSGLIRDQPDALILEQCVAIRLKHIDTQLHCAPRVRRNYNRCKSEKNPVSGETHQF